MAPTAEGLRTIEVRGIPVRYYEAGKGEVVLCLHGEGGLPGWSPYQRQLAEGFRVIAPEHPGFGEGGLPEWLSTMDDLAFFYLDALDAFEVERAHVIGFSLGGWLAAEFAARYGHRVDRLVLVGAMGLRVPGAEVPDLFMLSEEEQRPLRFWDPARVPAPEPDFLVTARALAATARLAWNPRFHDPKLPLRLHRVTAPTLLVWGEADRVVPPAHGHSYAERIAGSRLVVLERAGHSPEIERPDAFVRAVSEFLAGR